MGDGPGFLTVLGFAFVVILIRAVIVVAPAMAFIRTKTAQARRVYRRPFGSQQFRSELTAAALVLVLDVLAFATFRRFGLIPFAEATPARTLFTFGLFFVWYEIWFYGTHRLLHARPLYFLHAQHHVAKVTHPLTSLSFGLVERVILLMGSLGFAAIVARFVPLTLPGMVLYVLLNFVLNVWGHLNVELLPAGYGRSPIARVFFSTSFHAMHHARYQGHYGLFTTILDRALGTYWSDYPEVHARAATGNGLVRMSEKAVREGEPSDAPEGRATASPGR